MIETVGVGLGFVALAAVAFVASVRLGMLVGLRMDRALEARAATGDGEEPAAAGFAPSTAGQDPVSDGSSGREGVPR